MGGTAEKGAIDGRTCQLLMTNIEAAQAAKKGLAMIIARLFSIIVVPLLFICVLLLDLGIFGSTNLLIIGVGLLFIFAGVGFSLIRHLILSHLE